MADKLHFKRFGEIENHTNKKIITKLLEADSIHDTGTWVALEKVHGCNFSFTISKSKSENLFEIRLGKRSGFLEQGEDLNGISTAKILEKYTSSVLQAFDLVREVTENKDLSQMTIFGELFGGSYPHPDVPKIKEAKQVQKGVYYHNDNDFYAFDIYNGEKYLDYEVAMQIFQKCGFFFAEPIITGTLKEILEFPNIFESTLPKHYGHPVLSEENIAEGLILKPLKERRLFPGNKRAILKSKPAKFMEIAHCPKRTKIKTKPDPSVSENAMQIWDVLQGYITENRLDNIRSHGDQIDGKPLAGKQLIGPLARDVLHEFLRDESDQVVDLYNQLKQSEQKMIKNKLSAACQNLIFETTK